MRSPLISIMSNAAIKASKGMLRDFGEVDQLQISRKGTRDFVTKTDLRAEKMIHDELKKARPNFGYLMEEGGEVSGKESSFRWIIDPLDGTSNFIHAVPYFCISIALEEMTRPGVPEIVAAVIFDPIHNELFSAERNMGAFLNDRRLTVSQRDTLDQAMIAMGNPHQRDNLRTLELMNSRNSQPFFIRHSGASALDLAYVAAGRYDGCCFLSLKPWDMAAGMLLIKEAGGALNTPYNKPPSHLEGSIIATNQTLHAKLMKLLAV